MTRHFVTDYQKHVDHLMNVSYAGNLDEAMSNAVGGNYEAVGRKVIRELLELGLADNMTFLDFGCGSGRVSSFLHEAVELKDYLGIDVVQELLDYAQSRATANYYRFQLNHELSIPAESDYFDFAYAGSVFTHLQQAEIFLYMQDIHRVLKRQGRFVFTYLDLCVHHEIWQGNIEATKTNSLPHLNQFLDPRQIQHMARGAGFSRIEFIEGAYPRDEQSRVLLTK